MDQRQKIREIRPLLKIIAFANNLNINRFSGFQKAFKIYLGVNTSPNLN